MNPKKVFVIIALSCQLALMLATIIATAALVEFRDLPEFTKNDWTVFAVGISILLLLLIGLILLVIRSRRVMLAQMAPSEASEFLYLRSKNMRFLIVFFLSIGLAFACFFGGILLGRHLSYTNTWLLFVTLFFSFTIGVLWVVYATLRKHAYLKPFQKKKPEELLSYLLSHRKNAQNIATEKRETLQRLLRRSDSMAVTLGLLGALIMFLSGLCISFFSKQQTSVNILLLLGAVSGVFFGWLLCACTVNRIRHKIPQAHFQQTAQTLSEDTFPALYAVADRAKAKMGLQYKVLLRLDSDFDVKVCLAQNTIVISLGVFPVCRFSREELYTTLLHEMAHISSEENTSDVLSRHANQIEEQKFLRFPFAYVDAVYAMEHFLYSYAVSLLLEDAADAEMRKRGDVGYAVSALLQAKYFELYVWERAAHENTPVFTEETPLSDFYTRELAKFDTALSLRRKAWNKLIETEILAQNATHPTIRMRMEALGCTDYELKHSTDEEPYREEQVCALELGNKLWRREAQLNYAQKREIFYLSQKKKTDEWRAQGEPLLAHTYEEICYALYHLGEVQATMELCERSLASLPAAATATASYFKGYIHLHRFEEDGLPHIYRAIERDPRYTEAGLETIGTYCCLTGKEEELNDYRSRAINLYVQATDMLTQGSHIKGADKLFPPALSEQELVELRAFLREIQNGMVKEAYLVKKATSEDAFIHILLLRISSRLSIEKRIKLHERVTAYITTFSEQKCTVLFYTNAMPLRHAKRVANSLLWECENANSKAKK